MTTPNQTFRFVPVKASTTVTIYNKQSPVAPNTEFSQALTSGTKQLMIKCRSKNKLQFSFVSGESGTKYITIEKNAVYKVAEINLSGATLYMQTDGSQVFVEIEEWS